MKKTILRLIAGILSSAATMAAGFYFFIFANPLQIHETNILKWIPILICVASIYTSGLINRETSAYYLPFLFVPFVIFDLFNFFYFPFILILFIVGILTLVTTRTNIDEHYKLGAALSIAGIFTYFLLTQPLVIENEGFGQNENGELVNATVLWDFTADKLPSLPNHVVSDIDNNNFNLKKLEDKTYFVAFWATWCGPCLEEKPTLDSLKNSFQNNPNVAFVDISFDEDRAKWKQFLTEEQPRGLQLISKDVNKTRRVLNISALPLHYIVNPDGTYKAFPSLDMAAEVLSKSTK